MFTKKWKVYGADGHRQRESFNTCENRQNISVRYNGQNLRYDTEQMCIINKASNCIPRSEDVERWMFMLECAVRKRENNHYLKGDA